MNLDKKTKIFIDCHVFDSGFQGTRTYIQGIYKEFIKDENFHFYFGATNIENLKNIFGLQDNIFYIKYSYKNKFLRLLIDIPKIIKKEKIDYAHFQYIVPPFKKTRYIVTTHDVLFIDFPKFFPFLSRIKNTFLYKQGIKNADIKLTVSNYSKQRIEKHFKANNIKITSNAVDSIFYEDYNKEELLREIRKTHPLKNYIIYVSRWEPRKNHELILKTFVDLKLYESYELLFIGDSTIYNKNYFYLYDSLSPEIKDKIINYQKIDFNLMILLLRGAKACVYPSIAEGFGIPPLESIAAKIPTLSSNQTAMSDFTFMNEFLFNPYNLNQFKSKLKLILKNENEYNFQSLAEQSKTIYSWEKSMNVLKESIKEHQLKK